MAAELRWILLALSLLLLAGIWWRGARRSVQAPGNAALREPPIMDLLDDRHVGPDLERDPDPDLQSDPDRQSGPDLESLPKSRAWGVPPFEPLSIHTADFDIVPQLDSPMTVHAAPIEPPVSPLPPAATLPVAATMPLAEPMPLAADPMPSADPLRPAPAPLPLSAEHSDRFAAVAPQTPNASELQRVVTIRVCAPGETRWSGADLMAALELHGLAHGRYQVFHRRHVDGRSLFCVASLIEPGTFDLAQMPEQEFRGVTLFAVLPGPLEPVQTVDVMFAAARGLAEELAGMVQDAKGMPLSPQRAAALRDDVAAFQALLHGA